MDPTRENTDPLLRPQRLDDLLLYRLSVITRSASLPMVRLFEGELGITRRHWHVLALVAEHGSLSPSQIADLCWLDRPQVSRALAGLVEMGLLQRQPGVGRTRIEASDAGRMMYGRALQRVAAFNAELVSVLSAPQRAQLDAMLALLQAQVQGLSDATARTAMPARRSRGGRVER